MASLANLSFYVRSTMTDIGRRPKAVALKAVVLAPKAGEISWLLEVAIPFLYTFEWNDALPATEWRELERELLEWQSGPRLHEVRDEVSRLLGFSFSEVCNLRPPGILSEWSAVAESRDARALAKFVGTNFSALSTLAGQHKRVALSCGLPDTPVSYAPGGFLDVAKRRAVQPRVFEFFTQSYSLVLFFRE